MATGESAAGSTETISAGSEGACRLRHNRQGTWVDTPSMLLKLGWLAVGGEVQKCAACTHPASSSTLAQPIASALCHHEPGVFIEPLLT
jgi:hypothetical protein